MQISRQSRKRGKGKRRCHIMLGTKEKRRKGRIKECHEFPNKGKPTEEQSLPYRLLPAATVIFKSLLAVRRYSRTASKYTSISFLGK